MRIWKNARLLTMTSGLDVIADGVIQSEHGRILYAGPADEAPNFAAETIDLEGRLVTPGLIDCHTHLVFAGNRADEFRRRLDGESYADIARSGGGILSTVRATRAASETSLIAQTLPRLDDLIAQGVTTVEIKSGYGLTLDNELKMLRAARALTRHRHIRVRTTLLAAHAVPPEFTPNDDHGDAYIDHICSAIIPAAIKEDLADAVDAFCDTIGFTTAQTWRVFETAQRHGLPVKLHAEQLSNQHGAAMAAGFNALSADHLEHLDASGIAAMKAAGTVAVLLPAAWYCLRESHLPPVVALRRAGVPMALATDCNPGTAPVTSLLAVLNLAATLFHMTVAECLYGVTIHAAHALGLDDNIGTLEAGKACDLAIWNIADPAELVYWLGRNPLHSRVCQGEPDA